MIVLSIDSFCLFRIVNQEDRTINRVKTNRSEINSFINELFSIIDNPDFDINSSLFFNHNGKNESTLIDLDYDIYDVIQKLKELEISEFSETKFDCDDVDPPLLYVFGKEISGKLVYIKLKIRELKVGKKVICLSFHYAEEAMTFPYK